MQRPAAPHAGVAEEIAAIFRPKPRFFDEAAMFVREMREKFHPNPRRAAYRDFLAGVDSIGMQRRQRAIGDPVVERRGVVDKAQQRVFMIAAQRDHRRGKILGRQTLQNAVGAKAAVDIIADEDSDRLFAAARREILGDRFGEDMEKIGAAMNVADRVKAHAGRRFGGA